MTCLVHAELIIPAIYITTAEKEGEIHWTTLDRTMLNIGDGFIFTREIEAVIS